MPREFIGRQAVTRIGIVEPLPPVRMAVTKQARGLTVVVVSWVVVVVSSIGAAEVDVSSAAFFVLVSGEVDDSAHATRLTTAKSANPAVKRFMWVP